jgi:ABC-type Mn2+/Zn2+ transport system ATPase subunit
MSVPMVEFRNVMCQYGPITVLDHVNLRLQRAQFAGVLGPSGAGKTTLLKTILGLVSPSHGEICFNGAPLKKSNRPRIGYVPQVETVDWNFPLTVEQAVMMGRTRQMGLLPFPSARDRQAAYVLMERLEIAQFSQRHIRELSGGQQQRVFLARALLSEPDMLVLDEPTAGVDMRTQQEILQLLTELNRDGVTILMTTHDLNAAAAHLPLIICLNQTVIAQGTPDQVFTPEILNATYHGDVVVVKQDGLIFVQERPHRPTFVEVDVKRGPAYAPNPFDPIPVHPYTVQLPIQPIQRQVPDGQPVNSV